MQLRFCGRQSCDRFLRAYREGALRATLQRCLAAALAQPSMLLQLELRAGAEQLDAWLTDEEHCVQTILAQKVQLTGVRMGWGGDSAARALLTVHSLLQPDRLRDEELTELEDALSSLMVGSAGQSVNTGVTPAPSQSPAPSLLEEKPPPSTDQTFLFRGHPVGEVQMKMQGP